MNWDYEALEEIKSLHSYAEISPSGTGAHVIVKASIPKSKKIGNHEMYDHARYFTVTGNHIEGTPKIINNVQKEVTALYQKWFPEKEVVTPKSTVSTIETIGDNKILEAIAKAKNSEKFKALYEGNWQGIYPSQSEADLAFCGMLAFYTQDAAQIDAILSRLDL